MHIISKYKDYYDYLQGIYGVDPKLILDRRNGSYEPPSGSSHKIQLTICGMVYEGWYDEETNRCYYGDELLKFGNPVEYKYTWYQDDAHKKQVEIDNGQNRWNWTYVATVPYEDTDKINEHEQIPILLTFNQRNEKRGVGANWPQLSKYNFVKVIPPEEMFLKLSSWLSEQITKNETIAETRSEAQRIESRGFDKKRSFRPKMKN